MQLIEEIEISYFRSFYKFRMRNAKDLNIIFGKNDSGKSNVVRALNLFFSGTPDHNYPFDFPIDFSEKRRAEAQASENIKKFLYVKVTFNTPASYQPSLGEQFYVKRQWTVSRGQDYHEEYSNSIAPNRRHIAARLINKIRFIYIPAIKDIRIFEMLLSGLHGTVEKAPPFAAAVEQFSDQLQELTSELFETLPREVSASTKIGAPTRLSQLFQTLDFETLMDGETSPKSLIRQRGDGIKVRHIPELLNFISEKDEYAYHVWGFEEPENSLDFGASQAEAMRLLSLAKGTKTQIFVTTHSPSFYLLEDDAAQRYYISKAGDGQSDVIQGRELSKMDVKTAIGEGFYLPAVAEAIKNVANLEARARDAESRIETLKTELQQIASPVVLTEGRTDAKILLKAWEKLYGGTPPYSIRTCETGGENAGAGNGGTSMLSVRLKGVAADHPHAVIGLFDHDEQGIREFKLDKNFKDIQILGRAVKCGIHGRSYATCLPAPDYRAECFEHQNLPIEYLFRDEHLGVRVDGRGLQLRRKKATTKLGEKKIEIELEDVTHFKDILSGKTDFADDVVPTLPIEAFEGFEELFRLIEAIIQHNNNQAQQAPQ